MMDEGQRSTRLRLIIALFAASLLIRLIALMILRPPDLDTSATEAYLGGADLLLNGEGFRDTSYPVFAPPLYAMFISFCASLFGDGQGPVKVVQALVDSGTTVIIYFVTREIFGARTGLLSAAILTVYPFSIYLTISIAAEPLFMFFLSMFILLTIYAIRSQQLRYYCAAGILLGLATMTRAATQFMPLIFPMMILPFHRIGKGVLLKYTVFCLCFASVILPWAVRNYVVLQDVIPVATGGGEVFLGGSSEKFFTIDERNKAMPVYLESLRARGIVGPPKGSKPSENARFLTRAGIENYKRRLQEEPLSFILFFLSKLGRLWYSTESGRNQGLILATNSFIYVFALAGLVLAWTNQRRMAWVLVCTLVYFVALHSLSVGLYRYMIPAMPYVVGFSAFGIVITIERLGRGRKDRPFPPRMADE
jgi:4-amino-4-deoxy-L-arabinose transferase-like glycosyltransferase